MKKLKSLFNKMSFRSQEAQESREDAGREYLAESLEARVLYSGTVAPDAPVDEEVVHEAPAESEPEAVGADGSPVSAIQAAQEAAADMQQFVSEGIQIAGGETDIAEDQEVVILNPEVFGDLGAISQAAAEGAFDAAAERWSTSGVLTEDQGEALGDLSVQVADLEGDLLVIVSDDNSTILLDIDAAGREWFVDGTPLDDSEFTDRVSLNGFRAESGTATEGVDVLTILMEAQGALLGVDGVSAGREVSATGLEEGLRRIPIADEALTNPDGATTSLVADLANAASQRWEDSGLSEGQREALANIEYRVVDLSSGIIGSAENGVISIDIDAAGKGWFVDLSPQEDSEFRGQNSATSLSASEGSASEGVDLLSVIMHEQGHILGLEHVEGSSSVTIMTDLFSEGDRRLIEEGEAEDAVPGSLEGTHYATTQIGVGADLAGASSADNANGERLNVTGTETVYLAAGTYNILDFRLNVANADTGTGNAGTVTPMLLTGAPSSSSSYTTLWVGDPFDPTATGVQTAATYTSGAETFTLTSAAEVYAGLFTANAGSAIPALATGVGSTDHDGNGYTAPTADGQLVTGFSNPGLVRTYAFEINIDADPGDILTSPISFEPINADSDSGISSSKTYTHAIDFGDNSAAPTAVINDVVFANGNPGAFPVPTGTSQTVGTGSSTLTNSFNNSAGGIPFSGQQINNLLGDFIFNDTTSEITLTGLTPGAQYEFKLYNRQFSDFNRSQVIGFDTDGANLGSIAGAEHSAVFNPDRANELEPNFASVNQVYSLTYNYTLAPGVDTLTVYINSTGSGSYHLYGLTNEVLLDAVDDTSYAGAVVADSPLGYWRLGESGGATVATDSSGNGRDLEYQSVLGANLGQAGATADGDTAIAFVNTGADQIQSPNTTDFAFASGESFSIEYWAKFEPGNSTANDAGLITKGYDASQNRPWYLSRLQTDGNVELFLRNAGGTNKVAESTTNVEDGQWHHVVGVYDATAAEVRIYVDGVHEGTATGVSPDAYGTNAGAFTVGNHANRQVDGLIDEVAVYGAALTQEQIDAHYAAAPSLMRGTDEDTAVTIAAPGILGNDIPTDAPILGINDTTSLTGTSANGADVTVNADGSFTYDPTVAGATSIQALDEGAMLTDTFTYTTGLYEPIQGQVVRIVQNKPTGDNPLQMAEVEVLEFGTGTNLAPAGTASQSSQLSSFGPGRAIDGNYNNFHHTLNESGGGQTWQVDLGGLKDLDLVNIFSRVGCCFQGRTADIQLQVFSDAAATNMVYNERILGIGTSDSRSVRVATLVATDTATVNIEVTGVNDAPVGVDDDGGSVTETADINSNPTTTGNVLTNDTDVDDPNSSFTATPATITGTYGSVVINSDGSFTYTLDDADPDTQALFEGQIVTDTFAYTVNDNHSGGNAKTGTANLTISITGTNDAPVLVDDAAVVNEDGPAISIDVFAQPATEAKLTNPVLEQGVSGFSGNVAGTLNDGFAYDPAAPASALPDRSYSSNGDGFHNNNTNTDVAIRYDLATPVTIDGTNQVAVDLYGRNANQDRDDDVDILFLDGSGNILGRVDGSAIPSGAAHLRVSSLGAVPVGATIAGIRVIGHDSDGTPATSNSFTLMEIRAAVLVNDTDPDTGDTFTIQSIDTTGTTGLVVVTDAANGIVSYDPNGEFESLAIGETATDTFTYTVIDSNGDTATATVTVTITGENDGPTANADNQLTDPGNFITDEDTSFTTGNVLDNDTDPDTTNVLSVLSINTSGTSGTVIDNGDGTFGYDPNGQFESLAVGDVATDSFDYTVTDFSAGRFIMVQNNGPGARELAIGEIEVFGPRVTPAVSNAGGSGSLNPTTDWATAGMGASIHSRGATSGFVKQHGADSELIDGAEETSGRTWQAFGVGTFVIIDLGADRGVETVRVHQRNDSCCQNRLNNFTVTLLADDGTVNPGGIVQSGVVAGQPANNSFGEVTFAGTATATATATVTITGENDAPELATGVNNFNDVGVSQLDSDGDLVSYLVNSQISDVDDASVEGIAITGTGVSGGGGFEYSKDGGTSWVAVGTVSDSSAVLLKLTDRVRFVPDGTTTASSTLTFRAWDQTGGTLANYDQNTLDQTTKADASVTGGTTAYSTAAETISVAMAELIKDGTEIVYAPTDNELNTLTVTFDTATNELVFLDTTGNIGGVREARMVLDPGDDLTIETGNENDIVTIDLTGSGFSGNLIINGEGGLDTVHYRGSAALAAGSAASFTAEEITMRDSDLTTSDGAITLSATGGIAEGGDNFQGIQLRNSSLSSGSGLISLTGEGGDTGNHNVGVQVFVGSSITTTAGGSIEIDGTGGGEVSGIGVWMDGNASVSTTGNGTLTIDGTGGGTINGDGILLTSGVSLSVADGNMTINGTASGSGGASQGVSTVKSSLSSTGSGNIAITGESSGFGRSNGGVDLVSTDIDALTGGGTGSVTIAGTGSVNGTRHGFGVQLLGVDVTTAASATLDITGTGNGTGVGNSGVILSGDANLTGGIILIDGTGSVTGTSSDDGVVLAKRTDIVATGALTITGTSGTGSNSQGVSASKANLSGGSIEITGVSLATGGRSNQGISLGNTTLTSGATLNLTGTGGLGSKSNHGVYIAGGSLSASGLLTLLGTASGDTTGSSNAGVYMMRVNIGGLTGGSDITGSGGGLNSGLGNNNHGIFMHKLIGSITGPTTFDGTAGVGDQSEDEEGNYFPLLP